MGRRRARERHFALVFFVRVQRIRDVARQFAASIAAPVRQQGQEGIMNWIRDMALACSLFAAGCSHAASGQTAIAPLHRRGQTTEELVERGRAFALVGDLTRGEQYLSAALQRGAGPPDVLPLLVHVCVEAGRYRVAAEYLRMYGVEEPQSANAQLLYGSLEAAVGDREVARREYERLLRSHPDDST